MKGYIIQADIKGNPYWLRIDKYGGFTFEWLRNNATKLESFEAGDWARRNNKSIYWPIKIVKA